MDANAAALGRATTAWGKLTDARERYNALLLADRGVQGNNGLAGIKDPSLTSVRQPGSETVTQDNITTSTGYGQVESIAGQYTPPDNSGTWTFDTEAFYAAGGALGKFDNNAVRKFWRRTGAAPTRAAGTNAFGGSNTEAWRASKTVKVELNVSGKKVTVDATESAADQLVRALEAAKRSVGA